MRVLVACEFSQVVTKAFRDKGHEAYSCDILPTEGNSDWHIQDDVLKHLDDGWDLMIAHPPCTYLSYAGIGHWNKEGRLLKRLDALRFFATLWEAPIGKICIENPKGCASPTIAKYSQIIQPWYFGEHFNKPTCLWLKNLPPLMWRECDNLFGEKRTSSGKPEPSYYQHSGIQQGRKRYQIDAMTGGKSRSKNRTIFFQGIAQAMAEQWG